MNRWKTRTAWAGYLMFGLPAILAMPALISTLVRFGLPDTLTAGVPAALWACTPALLWLRYTRRRPSTRSGGIAWALLCLAAVLMILFSPIWFWSGPVLFVLLSEAARVSITPAVIRISTARRHRQTRASVRVKNAR